MNMQYFFFLLTKKNTFIIFNRKCKEKRATLSRYIIFDQKVETYTAPMKIQYFIHPIHL